MRQETPSVHAPGSAEPSSFNGITLDVLSYTAPAPAVGKSGSYTAVLRPDSGDSGPTNDRSPLARYRHFEGYSLYAGMFTTIPLDDSRVQFVEETPAGFEHSLLIRLETPQSSTVSSRYGLLESFAHGEMTNNSPVEIEFDLFYLAPLDRYRTTDDLRADLESPGF